ncbi:MAG: hypothetical protein ACRCZF_01615 [Gemmataceae bacterium]
MTLLTPLPGTKKTNETKYEAYEVVNIFARYTGAWQEYSQRINARHQIINMWFATSTGLMIFFSQKDLGSDLVNSTGIAMPALAAAIFSMLLLHDLMMMRLSKFMRCCELHNNILPSVNGSKPLPGYRTDPEFAYGFLFIRLLQNHVLAVVSVVLWIGTALLDQSRHAGPDRMTLLAHIVTGFLWLVALAVNYSAILWRIRNERPRNQPALKQASQETATAVDGR